MQNYVQPGNHITIPTTSAVASGEGVLIGQLFGVAAKDAAAGGDLTIGTRGVFDLPKEATATSFAVGDAVEWDGANGRVAAHDAGLKIGVVVAAAGPTAGTVAVRLA
jgi:predicted RecA/RadA family phage recombinase